MTPDSQSPQGGRLAGRVAIITGASGGIGSRLTRAFIQEGAKVAAVDVDGTALSRLSSRLAEDGLTQQQFASIEADVADSRACEACVQTTLDEFGAVHALVNNAGVGMGLVRPDYESRHITTDELSPQVWDRIMRINLSGAWYLSHYALPHMVGQGYGRIINVTTSFLGMVFVGGQPYGASKAGMEAMSVSHAGEFRGTGVTVNVVEPGGGADTPMIPKESPYTRSDLIDPDCMASPMIWLCGEAGDEVSGMRFIAADWDPHISFEAAAAASTHPAGWPELIGNHISPGSRKR